MIKAVIFDIDGTLIDSVDQHAEAWQRAFREFGREIEFYELRRQVGKGGDTYLPIFLNEREIEDFGEAVTERRGEILKKEFLSGIKPFPGVRGLFERIKADGKKIALASSANADELEEYKKIANIVDLIEEETSADDAEHSKPYPDIFEAALKKLKNINADEAIIIGDTAYDIQAAKAANVKSIGVLTGGWTKSELLRTGTTEVYKDVAQILEDYKDSPLAGKG